MPKDQFTNAFNAVSAQASAGWGAYSAAKAVSSKPSMALTDPAGMKKAGQKPRQVLDVFGHKNPNFDASGLVK